MTCYGECVPGTKATTQDMCLTRTCARLCPKKPSCPKKATGCLKNTPAASKTSRAVVGPAR